jgi:hypothetical protein
VSPEPRRKSLLIGASIGHIRAAGTLGCFAWRGQEAFLISSAEAIAPTGAERGDWIHSPAPAEEGQPGPRSRVAALARFDDTAASARLLSHIEPGGNRWPRSLLPAEWQDAAEISAVASEPGIGIEVGAFNRSSGFVSGKLEGVLSEVGVETSDGRQYLVKDMLLIDSNVNEFCALGDSGALVVARQPVGAVGLVIAATPPGPGQKVLVRPLAPILQRFRLAWKPQPVASEVVP